MAGKGVVHTIRELRTAPRRLLVGVIRLYQLVISPLYGPTCRFYPSCSQYALVAVQRHGILRGSVLAAWRVLRCNPWNIGGVDDVPPATGQDAHGALSHHHH